MRTVKPSSIGVRRIASVISLATASSYSSRIDTVRTYRERGTQSLLGPTFTVGSRTPGSQLQAGQKRARIQVNLGPLLVVARPRYPQAEVLTDLPRGPQCDVKMNSGPQMGGRSTSSQGRAECSAGPSGLTGASASKPMLRHRPGRTFPHYQKCKLHPMQICENRKPQPLLDLRNS